VAVKHNEQPRVKTKQTNKNITKSGTEKRKELKENTHNEKKMVS
jgi:hypothetical protein